MRTYSLPGDSKNGAPNVPFSPVGQQPPLGQAYFRSQLVITLNASGEVSVAPGTSVYVPQGIKDEDTCTPKTSFLDASMGASDAVLVIMAKATYSIPDGTGGGPNDVIGGCRAKGERTTARPEWERRPEWR